MTRRDTRDDGRIGIDIDRRTFLKTTAVTGVGLGGTAALSGSAAAQTTVSGGGDALQTAIDGASDGETIVVTDSETYDPIVVDKSLRIETDADPTIEGEGGITSTVSIEADDVTVDGFTITNPGGLIGVKVQPKDRSAGVGYDGATITNNTIEDLGPTEFLGVSGIIVGNGSYDDIEITNNTILLC
jgi:nitrous oxidase accessory protein NosD